MNWKLLLTLTAVFIFWYAIVVSCSGCVCYCRLGDQKIEVGEMKQESKGEVPSGLGALGEIILKGM